MTSLAVTSSSALPITPPQTLVTDIAKISLLELATGIVIAAVVSPFMMPAGVVSVLITTVNVVLANVALRVVQAFNRFLLERGSQQGSIFKCQKKFDTLSNDYAAWSFASLDRNRDTLTHEWGHYTAFKTLYQGDASIQVNPFQGGSTSFTIKGLNPLGNLLGERVSMGVLAAAGPLFSMITSLGLIAMGHFQEKESPKLAPYMKAMAAQSLIEHILYALSAYWDHSPGHDFALLAQLGVPPIVAAITLVALPILLKAGLSHFYSQDDLLRN